MRQKSANANGNKLFPNPVSMKQSITTSVSFNRIRLRSRNRIRLRLRLRSLLIEYDFDLVIEYDFDLPIEYEFVYHDFDLDLVFEYDFSQWYNLGAQGARKDHLLAGAFINVH